MQYNLANPRQAPGGATFATTLPSELTGMRLASHGKFYQWNRNVAWNSIGAINNWDATIPSGSKWVESNNPCPVGFTIPSANDFEQLLATCTKNYKGGWNGADYGYCVLTSNDKTLEFPAVGFRNNSNGSLGLPGAAGYYWSSIQHNDQGAYYLRFNNGNMLVDASNRSNGFSVRCIRSDERTVTIGDTEWMLYNVADPGTVATALPSELSGTRAASHGKFYQWNRKVAWATTGNISDWNTSTPSGTSWYASNNPCPSGFVVPTKSQWEALINTCTKSYKGGWNSEDYGYMELINGSNKLEFPAVGSR